MTDRFTIGQLYPHSTSPLTPRKPEVGKGAASEGGKSFQTILQDKLIRFSHHAESRLQQRGIQYSAEQLGKIGTAIDKAASKGAKDSLILIQDTALIVNVKNRTVVTAIDGNSMKDNVFTQIDSAIFIS